MVFATLAERAALTDGAVWHLQRYLLRAGAVLYTNELRQFPRRWYSAVLMRAGSEG